MKTTLTLKWLAAIMLVTVMVQTASAQATRAQIFDDTTPITWLGVDYTQAKFIGTASSYKDKGEVTATEFRDEASVRWNQLFIDEMKKYDVAKAVHRSSVKYAIDVTAQANKGMKTDAIFSNNPSDFALLKESDIAAVVKKYNFQKNDGIGFLFFVEGMSKGMTSEGIWVTFVDMKSKTVLFTTYKKAKAAGFGFRNYWAKPLYTVLKDMEDDYKTWKKGA